MDDNNITIDSKKENFLKRFSKKFKKYKEEVEKKRKEKKEKKKSTLLNSFLLIFGFFGLLIKGFVKSENKEVEKTNEETNEIEHEYSDEKSDSIDHTKEEEKVIENNSNKDNYIESKDIKEDNIDKESKKQVKPQEENKTIKKKEEHHKSKADKKNDTSIEKKAYNIIKKAKETSIKDINPLDLFEIKSLINSLNISLKNHDKDAIKLYSYELEKKLNSLTTNKEIENFKIPITKIETQDTDYKNSKEENFQVVKNIKYQDTPFKSENLIVRKETTNKEIKQPITNQKQGTNNNSITINKQGTSISKKAIEKIKDKISTTKNDLNVGKKRKVKHQINFLKRIMNKMISTININRQVPRINTLAKTAIDCLIYTKRAKKEIIPSKKEVKEQLDEINYDSELQKCILDNTRIENLFQKSLNNINELREFLITNYALYSTSKEYQELLNSLDKIESEIIQELSTLLTRGISKIKTY